MTRRVLTAAFAACLALPAAAGAQMVPTVFDHPSPPRVRITPFAGYLTGFVRQEQWTYTDGANVVGLVTDVHTKGGPGGGIHVEVPVRGLFGISAAAGLFSRDESTFVVLHSGDMRGIDGANTVLARLNVAFRMPTEESEFVLRRLDAAVYAGGVLLHDRLRNRFGTADLLDNMTQFGINLGLSAELPFAADRFAVQLGAEDNIMFWRTAGLEGLAMAYPDRPTGARAVTVSTSASHTWLLRAGLSMRVH
jgi:opacity protein-like surface antigen